MNYILEYGLVKSEAKKAKARIVRLYSNLKHSDVSVEAYDANQFRVSYEPTYNIYANGTLLFHRCRFNELENAIPLVFSQGIKAERIEIKPNHGSSKFVFNHRTQQPELRQSIANKVEIHYDCDRNNSKNRTHVMLVTNTGQCFAFRNNAEADAYIAKTGIKVFFKAGRESGQGLRNKEVKSYSVTSSGFMVDKSNRWANGQADFTTIEFRSDRLNEKYVESIPVLNPYLRHTGGGSTLPKAKNKKTYGITEIAMTSLRGKTDLSAGQVYKFANDIMNTNPLIGFVELRKLFKDKTSLSQRELKNILSRVF